MKVISALVISSALLSAHGWVPTPAGRVAVVAGRRLSPALHAEAADQAAANLSRRSVAARSLQSGLLGLAAGLAPWGARANAADVDEPFEVAFTVQLNADEAGEVVFKVQWGCVGKQIDLCTRRAFTTKALH